MRPQPGQSGTALWRLAERAAFAVLVLALLLPSLFVFYWMIASSLKPANEIYAFPPRWVFLPTFKNYVAAVEMTPFFQYLFNSVIVALGSSLVGLLIGLPAAYSIARYRQGRLGLIILIARIMPGVAYLVPLFVLFLKLHLVGTYTSLILSHLVVTFPLTVWIMVGFFEDLPRELMEAAAIDGCSSIGTFLRVAVPLTLPGTATAGILSFIFSWNDFKMALILSNSQTRTLPVAVFNFVHEAYLEWGPMMAYATIIALPVMLLTLLVQRHIVSGLTMGGVKS
jgi:multiple sugar transport system permease protein